MQFEHKQLMQLLTDTTAQISVSSWFLYTPFKFTSKIEEEEEMYLK